MADVFGNTQFGIPTIRKPQPASPAPSLPDDGVDPFGTSNIPVDEPGQPAPVSAKPDTDTPADRDTGETTTGSPPDKGVDPFGQTFETPPPEPDQPAPVTVDPVAPPVITSPVDGIGTDTDVVAVTSTPTGVTVPTGPDGETEFGRPVFAGDAEQAAEMEREWQVAREILLRRYLRGEEVAPTSRNQLREALGITNAEAAHLGLSDFSDAPDLREDPARLRGGSSYDQPRAPRASHSAVPCRPRTLRAIPGRQGRIRRGPPRARSLVEPEPIAPPDDGVDMFDPREWESGPVRRGVVRGPELAATTAGRSCVGADGPTDMALP